MLKELFTIAAPLPIRKAKIQLIVVQGLLQLYKSHWIRNSKALFVNSQLHDFFAPHSSFLSLNKGFELIALI